MPIDREILKLAPLFQLFDDEEIGTLTAGLAERQFVAGQTIFRLGDPGGEMHVVLAGRAEAFLIDDDGRRVVLAEFERGEMFGELSLFDAEPRSASVQATAETRTCVITRGDMEKLFTRKPHTALDILAVLSKRLRRTDVLLTQRVARNPNVVIEEATSWGDRIADGVARFGGSWSFILSCLVFLTLWVVANTAFVIMRQADGQPFDPYPFILLNLLLSMVAALQAPVIMMSQNRQDAKDRVRADLDYQVNLKAEIEIMELHQKVDRMKEELLELLVRIKNGPVPPARP